MQQSVQDFSFSLQYYISKLQFPELCVLADTGHESHEPVIDQDADHKYEQIVNIIVSIEPKGHTCQKSQNGLVQPGMA